MGTGRRGVLRPAVTWLGGRGGAQIRGSSVQFSHTLQMPPRSRALQYWIRESHWDVLDGAVDGGRSAFDQMRVDAAVGRREPRELLGRQFRSFKALRVLAQWMRRRLNQNHLYEHILALARDWPVTWRRMRYQLN